MQTFRQKIFIGYGASLILVVLILAWAMFMMLRLGRASESILRENYRSIQAAEHMIDAIERQDSAILLYLLGYQEQGLKEFRENETAFLQWLGRARDNITVPGEKEIIDSIEQNYTRYLGEVVNLHLKGASNQRGAVNLYHELILPVFRSTRDTCVKLREINHETMYAASNRAGQLSLQAVLSMSVIGSLAVIIGVVFSFFLSRLISRPVTELKKAALQIAEGNYEVQVPVQGSAELALLADQFNQMAEKLRKFHEMNIGKIIAEKLKSDAIIQNVDDGIMVVDDQLVIDNINPKAALIFGVHKDNLLGKHFFEAVRDERLFQLLKQSVETGDSAATQGRRGYLYDHLRRREPALPVLHHAHAVVISCHSGRRFTSPGHHPVARIGPVKERICFNCFPRVAHSSHQREHGRGFADGVGGAEIDRQGTGIVGGLP